ncbi:hypothetical protein GGF41_008605, partial [Coemansia sp. RSA 2531]
MFYAPLAYSKERIMAPSTVPFPELESLRINMPYPFADDVLFRGNSTTLKDLDFKIDTDSVHLLYDSGVFANKRRKLRTLTLSKDSRTHGIYLLSETILSNYLRDLINPARKLVISYLLLLKPIIAAAIANCSFMNVQVLSVGSEQLHFYDILCLLKVFPALVKFTCGIEGLGSELEHIAAENLPDYIASTYKLTGKCLQVWAIPSFHGLNNADITEY